MPQSLTFPSHPAIAPARQNAHLMAEPAKAKGNRKRPLPPLLELAPGRGGSLGCLYLGSPDKGKLPAWLT